MFERFKHRSHELERLDTGDYTPYEYAKWQREMKIIHRVFGEMRALKGTLFRDIQLSGLNKFSVLDVGAGSGGLMLELNKWSVDQTRFLVGSELDAVAAASIKSNGIISIQCDALQLPFGDNAFDYVICSLFLHHLGDEDAIALIGEMARVAARRIYVIDLNRHPIAYYLYKIFGSIFLQRFTLEDGALSILRSRTPTELFELSERAGLQDIKVEHSRANRLILSGSLPKPA